jgi:hypothetical protein
VRETQDTERVQGEGDADAIDEPPSIFVAVQGHSLPGHREEWRLAALGVLAFASWWHG